MLLQKSSSEIHTFLHIPVTSIFNASEISTFFLTGIPQVEYAHIWVSIPICFIYPIVILGNWTILIFLRTQTSLNELFPVLLSVLFPLNAGSFWPGTAHLLTANHAENLIDATGISPDACFAQEFFIHGFSVIESLVLPIMSVNCFKAIFHPLRYTTILTTVRVIKIGLCFLFVLPFPFILKKLRFCKKSLLSHSYCLHQDVMKVACSHHRVISSIDCLWLWQLY